MKITTKVEEKDLKILLKILLGMAVVLFVTLICPIALQNDTLYDIVLGQKYCTQGMFTIDNYSIHEGLIYQTHHYFVCVIEYIIYHVLGFNGLHLLEVVLAVIIAGLFYKNNKYFIKSKFLAYCFLFVELLLMQNFIAVRAQMFSYIVFLIEILCINKFLDTNKKKYFITLCILPLILANFHSGVIFFYFIIILVYMLNILRIKFLKINYDERVTKSTLKYFILIIVIGSLLTLINPYGYKAITYGIKTLNDGFINNNISEFLPYNIKITGGLYIFIYMLFITLTMVLTRKNIKLPVFLLSCGTILMTLISRRHFSLFVITSVVVLPYIEDIYEYIKQKIYNIKFIKNKSIIRYVAYAIIAVLYFTYVIKAFFSFSIFEDYVSEYVYPIKSTEYIKSQLPKDARIFNDYGWGSYLMFNDVKVFIDSRADLYTDSYNKGITVAQDYIGAITCNKYYADIFKKYDIQYVLIKKNVQLAKMLLHDNNYKVIYQDNVSYLIKVL